MTRIAPSPMPGVDAERVDRGERAPAGSGAPFRAAMRKADKDKDKATRSVDDPLPPPPAPSRPQRESEPRSIADVIASSTDGAGDRAVRAPGAAENAAVPAVDGDLAGAALAGTGVANPATGAPAQGANANASDSPVTAWVAAAVSRAIGSFGGSAAGTAHTGNAASTANVANAAGADGSTGAPAVGPTALASAGLEALSALSPLEQAVHDLIGRATERAERAEKDARDPAPEAAVPDAASVSFHVLSAHAPEAPAPQAAHAPASAPAHGAQRAQLPEPPANPSHVHLVLDDGPERTVVTVAVRGSEVRVALRASDDATGAALARNAASLDHAMRARGLSLGELTAEREPRDQRPPRDPEPRERRPPSAERFELEEKP